MSYFTSYRTTVYVDESNVGGEFEAVLGRVECATCGCCVDIEECEAHAVDHARKDKADDEAQAVKAKVDALLAAGKLVKG